MRHLDGKKEHLQWDDRLYILNFEVKQRGDLNTNWCPALKLRALLHPNWTKLWHRSWIYLYKCIVAGLFQLILQIPGPGFEIKILQCLSLLNCITFNYFTYHTRCKISDWNKISLIQYHSLQPLGLHSFIFFIQGMPFDGSDSKDWLFIAALFLFFNFYLWFPRWLIIF